MPGYDNAYKNEELIRYREQNAGKKYTVNRLKGLGEMSVEETEETLTDPDNRIIHKVTVADIPAADKLFDDLMGTKIEARKNYIKEHSNEAKYSI